MAFLSADWEDEQLLKPNYCSCYYCEMLKLLGKFIKLKLNLISCNDQVDILLKQLPAI